MNAVSSSAGVVVLGFPRSGTTLLRRLLESHPDMCCPPETHLLRSAAAFLQQDDSPLGYSADVLTSLRFSGLDPETVVDRLRDMVFGIYADICNNQNKRVWVEKSALDIFHVDAIERLLGDRCRFIWLTRHAIDVLCSVKEYVSSVEIYYPELFDYVRRYPVPMEAFAHAWIDTQARMSQFIAEHPDTCLQLRYEDLVTDPADNLQRILDFLGMEGDPVALVDELGKSAGMIGYGDWKAYERDGVSTESVGRHHELPPRLLGRLAALVNPTMLRLGYQEVSVPRGMQNVDPVRELQLRLMTANMRRDSEKAPE